MSREIKFRGKNIATNEWVYGGYYKHLKRTPSPIGDSIKEDDYQPLIINSSFSDWNMPKQLECFGVDEKTVGQYTGLKDKNGKEIYEGDIVQYTFDLPESLYATENGLKPRIHKVFWSDWRSSFAVGNKLANNDLFRYVRNGNRAEVIGNIYDNPELLNS